MTLDDAKWLLKNITNPCVKTEPSSRGGYTVWGKARLLSVVNDEYAMIQPFGHRREERVAIASLHKWSAKNGASPPKPLTEPLAEKLKEKLKEKTMNQAFHRKYTDQQRAEVLRLRQMGKKMAEIAVITQIPRGTIPSLLPDSVKTKYHKVKYSKKQEDKHVALHKEVVAKIVEAAPKLNVEPRIEDSTKAAIRAIIGTPISDTQKLFVIEALLS